MHDRLDQQVGELIARREDALTALREAVTPEQIEYALALPVAAFTGREEAARHLADMRGAHQRYWHVVQAFDSMLDEVRPEDWHRACTHGVSEGVYTVILTRTTAEGWFRTDDRLRMVRLVVSAHAGLVGSIARETLKRVDHVGPEPIVEGVSLDDAIAVKSDLERWGAAVKITEGIKQRSGGREPIPERVRREVWRRDGGRCVDCGSRERLEYDHIIPVTQGGSNTARNIELRCESCNRRKAASI